MLVTHISTKRGKGLISTQTAEAGDLLFAVPAGVDADMACTEVLRCGLRSGMKGLDECYVSQ